MKQKRKGKIIIIAGSTGSGESSVTQGVLKKLPDTQRMITATNRPLRNKEKHGHDYFFYSTKEFKERLKKGEFLEHTYIANRKQYYATIKKWNEDRLSRGINLIGNLDWPGAKFYKENYQALILFIKPERFSRIKERLLNRQPNMDPKLLKLRLENARAEMKEAKYYDHVIINPQGKLSEAIEKTLKIINKYLKVDK